MSIHTLRKILELAPEVLGHIKQAKVNQEFPTDCKDSVLASALEIEYMTKIAHKLVDPNAYAKVQKAVDLYGLGDEVARFSSSMVKVANVSEETAIDKELRAAEAMFESNLGGNYDLEKVAQQAETLVEYYEDEIKSDLVKRYAGDCGLNKSAALVALKRRHFVTKNSDFVKLAEALEEVDEYKLSRSDLCKLASTVTKLDKESCLPCGSFDFYKEAFITKQAAVSAMPISIAGSQIPYENIVRMGKSNLAQVIGSDVVSELGDLSDAPTVKAVLESLPLDLQKLLKKHCG